MRKFLLHFVILPFAACACGQDPNSPLYRAGCVSRPAESGRMEPFGPAGRKPVIFGTPYFAPALKFRVANGNGQPPQRARIMLKYSWHWLEYPYPEHPFGVISDAWDVVECPVADSGFAYVPEFEVRTRGWYAGIFLRPILPPWRKKLPEFYEIEIDVLGPCEKRLRLDRQQLDDYRTHPTTIEVVCRKGRKQGADPKGTSLPATN